MKSTILKAVFAAVVPIDVVEPTGNERPSVTPEISDIVVADVPSGKRMGYPGLAPAVRSPRESDTGLVDGVGAVVPPMDCGSDIAKTSFS